MIPIVENMVEGITAKDIPLSIPENVQSDLCYDSYLKGQRDANLKNESFWGVGNFCLNGCLCGLPGSALSLIALNSKQKPKKIPENMEEKCYMLGFQNQQAKRRVYSVAIGGLASAVVIFGIYFTIFSMTGSGF